MSNSIKHVAIIGTGVIGISWATLYLQQGLRVTATDVARDAEQKLREGIFSNAPGLSQDLLKFEADLQDAVDGVDLVQENGPEEVVFKQAIFKKLDEYTPSEVLLVSSSSGIIPSVIQSNAGHPERILVGHPFNPPHIIPLVEVCGGKNTCPESIARVMQFYASVGKKPIHLQKEMVGHVANRLQAALWQEALYLVQQGVVSIHDLDTAVAEGPGLRWALMGPFTNMNLGGGEGGIRHFLEHLGQPINSWFADLGKARINEELIALLSEGVKGLYPDKDYRDLAAVRDRLLKQLTDMKKGSER